MSTSEPATLRIEGDLDVAGVPAQWKRLRPLARGIERIDLGAVGALDSSGVAMIRCLQAAVVRAGGKRPVVVGAPPRLAQICLAHRVEAGGD